MQGNPKLIETLNALLADELAAINQYIVHAEMCEDWGYGKLHKSFEQRAIQEMRHAEQLIGRILFLGGTPIVSELNNIHIGKDVPKQVENDRAAHSSKFIKGSAGMPYNHHIISIIRHSSFLLYQ
jgi:bacterioferritin